MKKNSLKIKDKIIKLKRKSIFISLVLEDKRMQMGIIIVVFFILMATIGPAIFPLDLRSDYTNRYQTPSFKHLLGTDFAGRDTWSMLVHGSRDVMLTAAFAAMFSMLFGILVGSIAGFSGGWTDIILMRIVDAMLTIPSFPVMMIMAATFKVSNPVGIGLVLSLWTWAGLARAIRAQILSLKTREFIQVARMLNFSKFYIITHELLPNMMSYIIVNFIRSMRGALTASIGLMYLGIIPYTATNWGMMLNLAVFQTGTIYVPRGIWYMLAPMGAIILFQYGTLGLASGLEELFNPRLRENE